MIATSYHALLNALLSRLSVSHSVMSDTFVTLWTVAHQAPLSIGFSRQECWSGLPFPPPGDLPNPGIEPQFPALQPDSEPPGKPIVKAKVCLKEG